MRVSFCFKYITKTLEYRNTVKKLWMNRLSHTHLQYIYSIINKRYIKMLFDFKRLIITICRPRT